ncbi:MAG: hypothetical protein CMF62_03390 [Magnetococcales bacterium]|nr:hypothetical protein [Magnetococcales bacterium]|tara:strand:- start:9 stop:521 length:513 start_codon:yes stop_codon:yes gene_type:complete
MIGEPKTGTYATIPVTGTAQQLPEQDDIYINIDELGNNSLMEKTYNFRNRLILFSWFNFIFSLLYITNGWEFSFSSIILLICIVGVYRYNKYILCVYFTYLFLSTFGYIIMIYLNYKSISVISLTVINIIFNLVGMNLILIVTQHILKLTPLQLNQLYENYHPTNNVVFY